MGETNFNADLQEQCWDQVDGRQGTETMREPIGVGVLGYGYAGRCFHAYLLRFEPRFRLCTVASRAPDRRVARAPG